MYVQRTLLCTYIEQFIVPGNRQLIVQMPMELLEYKSNAWGQRVLEGVSWDLVWVFLAAGLMVVVVHSIYVAWRKVVISRQSRDEFSTESTDG